jgi:hypothetical protein
MTAIGPLRSSGGKSVDGIHHVVLRNAVHTRIQQYINVKIMQFATRPAKVTTLNSKISDGISIAMRDATLNTNAMKASTAVMITKRLFGVINQYTSATERAVASIRNGFTDSASAMATAKMII